MSDGMTDNRPKVIGYGIHDDYYVAKRDRDKPRWDLLPMAEVEGMVRILTKALADYGEESWKTVPEGRKRYFAALMRHVSDWAQGRITDDNSKENHMLHVACNALFLAWLDENGTADS